MAESARDGDNADDLKKAPQRRVAGADDREPPRPNRLRLVLLFASLAMAVFLAALDAVMVATALPSISVDLRLASSSYAWISTSYLLGTVVTMVAWAKASDVFGRKSCLLAANMLFMVGCLICALAENLAQLIAGRAIQGLGAGGMLVLPNVCLSDLFSLRERGFYLSLLGGVWAIASSIGPIVGGAFSQYVTWRWIFWINLPCDALCLLGLFFFLNIHNPKTPLLKGFQAIDWLGVTLLAAGTIIFLLGIDFGGVVLPWSAAAVICLITFGIVTWILFGIWQWKCNFPILPLRIFTNTSNLAVYGVCFFHGMSYIAVVYYLPLYFQAVLGASPLLSGVYLLALAIPLTVVAITTGVVIRKTGGFIKELVIIGMALMTLGVGLFINLQAYASWPRIIIFQILVAIGMSPVFQAPLVILQTTLDAKDIASAISAFALTRQVASSVSLVVGQAIIQSQVKERSYQLVTAQIPAQFLSEFENGSFIASIQALKYVDTERRPVVRGVLSASISNMWIFFTCSCFIGFLLAFGFRQKKLSNSHSVHRPGLSNEN